MNKPVALLILDGYGENPSSFGNAVKGAKTPNLDKYRSEWPITFVGASGEDVGLPDGQMGNSEVGHTNIGAGRVVYQELTRISKSIRDGDFYNNKALNEACDACLKNGTALHLMGLMSDGGVHSHKSHLWALLELAKRKGLKKVYIHCFLDGRDVAPSSGAAFVKECIDKCAEIGVGQIATVMGRFYAMDRDNRWERVSKAYNALYNGKGIKNPDAVAAIRKSYTEIDPDGKNITDEFVAPVICVEGAQISKNDSIIFFNFRPDRAREITRTMVDEQFNGFTREEFVPVNFVCLTQYDAKMPNVSVAFKPQSLHNTFGEYIAQKGLTQLRIAETEKYAHVTFFFNGGVETVSNGEDRDLIPSPKVTTYDLKPEMSAYEVAEKAVSHINSEKHNVIILNFANCDMVGHTGMYEAAVAAVEAVDKCVGQVVEAILAKGGVALITADHGNADKMLEEDNTAFTAHTTFPVPFITVGSNKPLKEGCKLSDIAPTMLELLGLEKPIEMDGQSIIK